MQYRSTSRKRIFGPKAEALVWSLGLVAVIVADPNAPAFIETCLLKAVGFTFCPGCGLGHAVGFLARGELNLAIESHPFAPFAVAILLHRIVTLWKSDHNSTFELREKKLNYVQNHQISA